MSPWTPYSPGTRSYPPLSGDLERQLKGIEPSRDRYITYHPCAVVLADGTAHERVYLQDALSYIRVWGVWPEDDPAKRSVDVAQVVRIRASANRLPPPVAQRIYEAGECGMGYTIFTLVFRDGTTQAYVMGNAIDFVTYPAGKTGKDIASVVPHSGENPYRDPVGYVWCLHGSTSSTPGSSVG